MTKAGYIKLHPRSYLAAALRSNSWPGGRQIEVVSGQEAPDNKSSNLYKALARSRFQKYETGGRLMNKSDGMWFAVA